MCQATNGQGAAAPPRNNQNNVPSHNHRLLSSAGDGGAQSTNGQPAAGWGRHRLRRRQTTCVKQRHLLIAHVSHYLGPIFTGLWTEKARLRGSQTSCGHLDDRVEPDRPRVDNKSCVQDFRRASGYARFCAHGVGAVLPLKKKMQATTPERIMTCIFSV